MTCAALFVLIYFIHHVARSIQAPNVILSVASELRTLISVTYPANGRQGSASIARDPEEIAAKLQPERG
ncbi:MAG: DUF2254 family protein, partial [Synergistota bacterium]|nr:DUF2254 family protein [Synergistota bacterium]